MAAGVKDGVLVPTCDGVWAEPNRDIEAVPNGVDWGVKVEEPKTDKDGVDAVGVEKRNEEVEAAAAEDGVLNIEKPDVEAVELPGCWGILDIVVAELANKPAPWVDGCAGTAGKCKVGWTLLAAASCLAVARLSASRKGSFPSPQRRWLAR